MSILAKITTGRQARPQKVCLYGPEGLGKSTLASLFPAPLFFDVEDSTSQLDVRRLSRRELPDLSSVESALDELAAPATGEPRPCATLVIDTIDWLEQLILDRVIAEAASPKIRGIEDFRYGKGYTILRERTALLLARLDRVVAAGLTVVLLAHSRTVKFEPPDGLGAYDRFELKLTRQVAPLVKEWADMLLFGNWRTLPPREGEKSAPGEMARRERVLYCHRSPAWDAKNRHGLADAEPWDIAVLERAFRGVGAPWGPADPPPPAAPSVAPRPVTPCTPPAAGAAPLPAPGEDIELERICGPHTSAVSAYLLADRRIRPGQDWRAITPEYAARIKRNPAGFLKTALRPLAPMVAEVATPTFTHERVAA